MLKKSNSNELLSSIEKLISRKFDELEKKLDKKLDKKLEEFKKDVEEANLEDSKPKQTPLPVMTIFLLFLLYFFNFTNLK